MIDSWRIYYSPNARGICNGAEFDSLFKLSVLSSALEDSSKLVSQD